MFGCGVGVEDVRVGCLVVRVGRVGGGRCEGGGIVEWVGRGLVGGVGNEA